MVAVDSRNELSVQVATLELKICACPTNFKSSQKFSISVSSQNSFPKEQFLLLSRLANRAILPLKK